MCATHLAEFLCIVCDADACIVCVWLCTASKFMGAMAADGLANAVGMTDEELDRIYSPLRQQVTDSLYSQESVMYNVEVCTCVCTCIHTHTCTTCVHHNL